MARLTITISDELHRGLEQEAARQKRSIDSLIEEGLRELALPSGTEALEIVRQARETASLSESEAREIAEKETRPHRG